jgi:hypothetical protein
VVGTDVLSGDAVEEQPIATILRKCQITTNSQIANHKDILVCKKKYLSDKKKLGIVWDTKPHPERVSNKPWRSWIDSDTESARNRAPETQKVTENKKEETPAPKQTEQKKQDDQRSKKEKPSVEKALSAKLSSSKEAISGTSPKSDPKSSPKAKTSRRLKPVAAEDKPSEKTEEVTVVAAPQNSESATTNGNNHLEPVSNGEENTKSKGIPTTKDVEMVEAVEKPTPIEKTQKPRTESPKQPGTQATCYVCYRMEMYWRYIEQDCSRLSRACYCLAIDISNIISFSLVISINLQLVVAENPVVALDVSKLPGTIPMGI